MSTESQFFKPETPKQPEEELEPKAEEINFSEEEIEKTRAELAAEKKEQHEEEGFLIKMQEEEQKMVEEVIEEQKAAEKSAGKGILTKLAESPRVKGLLMGLALSGIVLAAERNMAEAQTRGNQGWQNSVRQAEKAPYQYQAREQQKVEAIKHQYQLKERARFEAYQEYLKECEAIQKAYEQRKFDIMIGRVEGATDYSGKQRAYQSLEQWNQDESTNAKQRWAMKAWAAEEEYRMKTQQIQQWR